MTDNNETTISGIEFAPDEEFVGVDGVEKIKKLKENFKKCEQEKKEYLDGWQRSKAEHINYKKDEAKRFEDMARFVTSGLIEDILPVLDSFDLALAQLSAFSSQQSATTGQNRVGEQGMLLIRSQLEDVLKKRGLIEIGVKPGDKFDPAIHESVGEVVSEFKEGEVSEIVQRGYFMRDKVLRPARVRISKKE